VYIDGSVGIDRKIEEEGIVQTEVAKRCERSAFQAVRESGHWEATGGIFKDWSDMTLQLSEEDLFGYCEQASVGEEG